MVRKISTTNYKDRSVGLIVFGVLEILMGLAALGMGVWLVSLFMKRPNISSALWFGSLFCLGIAVAFVWLGIGSIRARRWARTLILILSWIWLIVGIVGGMSAMVVLPAPLNDLAHALALAFTAPFGTPSQERQGLTFTLTAVKFILIFIGVIFLMNVLISATLILFYRSPHVKATCQAKDPKIR